MILEINFKPEGFIVLELRQGSKTLAKKQFKADRYEAEKLLPALAGLLKAKKINLKQIKKIKAANSGGSFTSARVRVVTANALAYALNIPVAGDSGGEKKIKAGKKIFSLIQPRYSREPEITVKRDGR